MSGTWTHDHTHYRRSPYQLNHRGGLKAQLLIQNGIRITWFRWCELQRLTITVVLVFFGNPEMLSPVFLVWLSYQIIELTLLTLSSSLSCCNMSSWDLDLPNGIISMDRILFLIWERSTWMDRYFFIYIFLCRAWFCRILFIIAGDFMTSSYPSFYAESDYVNNSYQWNGPFTT